MKTPTILMVIAIIMLAVPVNSQAGTISAKNANVDIQLSGYLAIDAPQCMLEKLMMHVGYGFVQTLMY